MYNAVISIIISALSAVFCFFSPANLFNDYVFNADVGTADEVISNKASNVNVWEMGQQFFNPVRNEKADVFEFVKYVQLMQCTGGNETRDLFKDPLDFTVKDDYKFDRLLKNCEGILSLGAKPHLILGSVPLKFTENALVDEFETNVYPPDDYDAYYEYIKAICTALADKFGKDEVLTWHFGVMTEYENSDWFISKSGTPEDSAEEFCRLYDTTVAALEDVFGDEVYVGAHSMTVTEGLWDEEIFIRHCAEGTNFRTGEKGTRLCYLTASFYDYELGTYTGGYDLPGTINVLRSAAEKYGLYGLKYGIDEGRILSGTPGRESNALLSRSTGFTWQGAYDARLYGQMIENDIDYFSYWCYLSDGLLRGNPTVSYHVAKNVAAFDGSKAVKVEKAKKPLISAAEVKCFAGFNEEENTLHMFCYNFRNTLAHVTPADIKFNIDVSDRIPDGNVKIRVYSVDDDCNYFDEWCHDRIRYHITDDCFNWSPDDGVLSMLDDPRAKQIYETELFDKYADCSVLNAQDVSAEVKNGVLTFRSTVKANTVVFYEISPENN